MKDLLEIERLIILKNNILILNLDFFFYLFLKDKKTEETNIIMREAKVRATAIIARTKIDTVILSDIETSDGETHIYG